MPETKPSVLFVCVHNAGRSQMAAGFLTHLAGGRIEVRSAGSAPADAVNPAAVEAMKEVGIDISDQTPKILTVDAVQASDVCITMGCGDTCPVFPGPGRPNELPGTGVNRASRYRPTSRCQISSTLSGRSTPERCPNSSTCAVTTHRRSHEPIGTTVTHAARRRSAHRC